MQQSEILDFLSDPSTHGADSPVEVITTHSAHVILVGDHAYKIKRSVKYNYLDFTTPEARRNVIRREHALNAPAAPQIYDRIVAITREPSGELALEGNGEPIEYALRMHRFPREAELTAIADAGNLTNGIAEKLGTAIARYHAAAEICTADGADLIKEIIEELREAFSSMDATLGADRLAKFLGRTDRMFERLSFLLTERAGQGFVRRCHGDLHLKNLVLIEGVPVPFDALEFDERLGTCDVAYDLAFLVMDLLHRRLFTQANVVLNSYLRATRDFTGLAAMPLFLSIRAAIRSMVGVQSMSGEDSEQIAVEARSYLDQATRYLTPDPPRLVAIGGVSGTGKTTVSAGIAPILGPSPGAVHLRSDLERKVLFGVDPLERLPDEAYQPGVTQRVYDRVLSSAEEILRAHHSVIVDATFLSEEQATAVREVAERVSVPFDGLWLSADPDTLARRVASRADDASDADIAVLQRQLERKRKPKSWQHIDADGDPDAVVATIEACLFTV